MFSPQSWCEAAARPRPHHSVAGGHAVEPDKRQLSLLPGRAGSPRSNRAQAEAPLWEDERVLTRVWASCEAFSRPKPACFFQGRPRNSGNAWSRSQLSPAPAPTFRAALVARARTRAGARSIILVGGSNPFGRDCYSHFTAREQEPVSVPWLSGWPSNPWGCTLPRSVTGAPHAGSLLSGDLESGGRCPSKTKFAGGFS